MNNPGEYDLGSYQVAGAVTDLILTEGNSSSGVAQAFLDRLNDMESALLDVNFTYGAGGTTAVLTVETKTENGWLEVARFAFGTASARKVQKINRRVDIVAAYTPAALSDNTAKSGIFGTAWRAKLNTAGTYTGNTLIAARLIAA